MRRLPGEEQRPLHRPRESPHGVARPRADVTVRPARKLVRLIADGVVVFAWYPDKALLAKSEYLDRSRLPLYLSNNDD